MTAFAPLPGELPSSTAAPLNPCLLPHHRQHPLHRPTNPDDFAASARMLWGKCYPVIHFSPLAKPQPFGFGLPQVTSRNGRSGGKCYLVTPFFPSLARGKSPALTANVRPRQICGRPSSSHHQLSKWQRCREEKKVFFTSPFFQRVHRSLCQPELATAMMIVMVIIIRILKQ